MLKKFCCNCLLIFLEKSIEKVIFQFASDQWNEAFKAIESQINNIQSDAVQWADKPHE